MSEATYSQEVVVVVGCDDRYALPLSVTLSSMLRNADGQRSLRLVVLDGGIGPDSRRRIERVIRSVSPDASVDWHDTDGKRFEGLKVTHWGSTANYLRLLIPDIVGPETEWVLYLDSDLLVRDDVSLLADEAQGSERPVLAVGDYHHRRCATVYGLEGCAQIGLDPDSPYFNSGVLALDVAAWREEDVASQAIDFVRTHASVMKHSDQDALNAVLANRWQPIDPLWNVMVASIDRFLADNGSGLDKEEMIAKARVLHFTSSRKPWLPGYVGPSGFEYRRALRESGWFDNWLEWSRWHARFWLTSPPGWLMHLYRRTRKRAALVYRSMRSRDA